MRWGNHGPNNANQRRRAVDSAAGSSNSGSTTDNNSVQQEQAFINRAGQEAFVRLVCRNDGWLRIVPHDEGSIVYFKWKWSRGEFKGHYVMWLCSDFNYSLGLQGLLAKVESVDEGLDRPVKDRAYDD